MVFNQKEKCGEQKTNSNTPKNKTNNNKKKNREETDMNKLYNKCQTKVNQLKLKCTEWKGRLRLRQQRQPIKICQQFLWLFRVWLQLNQSQASGGNKIILTGTTPTTTSGTLDFCAFPAAVTRIQPFRLRWLNLPGGWLLSFAFGLPFMAFVFSDNYFVAFSVLPCTAQSSERDKEQNS